MDRDFSSDPIVICRKSRIITSHFGILWKLLKYEVMILDFFDHFTGGSRPISIENFCVNYAWTWNEFRLKFSRFLLGCFEETLLDSCLFSICVAPWNCHAFHALSPGLVFFCWYSWSLNVSFSFSHTASQLFILLHLFPYIIASIGRLSRYCGRP